MLSGTLTPFVSANWISTRSRLDNEGKLEEIWKFLFKVKRSFRFGFFQEIYIVPVLHLPRRQHKYIVYQRTKKKILSTFSQFVGEIIDRIAADSLSVCCVDILLAIRYITK